MFFTALPQRGLLSFSGADAESFLQGLVSNDLYKLKGGAGLYAALLTPQGKFLHDFFIARRGDTILIDCDQSRLTDLVQRLTLYKLRSQVTITQLSDEGVVAVWGTNSALSTQHSALIFPDPRLPALGYRFIGEKDALAAWCKGQGWQEKTPGDYDALRLEFGVPDGAQDMKVDKSFLLECGFEDLHGVDFAKGCYVGQEVTARTKYRGQVRKFFYQVRAEKTLPPPGTPVTLDGVEVGQLRSHAGQVGLAILRIEAVQKAATEALVLYADMVALTVSVPSWTRAPAA